MTLEMGDLVFQCAGNCLVGLCSWIKRYLPFKIFHIQFFIILVFQAKIKLNLIYFGWIFLYPLLSCVTGRPLYQINRLIICSKRLCSVLHILMYARLYHVSFSSTVVYLYHVKLCSTFVFTRPGRDYSCSNLFSCDLKRCLY